MAYNKQTSDNSYVQSLIDRREKKLNESFKKAKSYLSFIKFFEKDTESKIEYLKSKDGLILLEGMSANKMSFVSISDCLEINQNRLHEILRDNAEIYDAIDRGRSKEIDEIEDSLNELAKGYYKTEKRVKNFENERGSSASQTESYERYFPANVYAATYILQMKRDKEWKQKQLDMEVAKNTIKVEIEIIGDDETNLE
ncbi:hypothetical protein [Methanoculleus sp.]|jgi:hypothetical protein|uniref:hypothetical protein n=1 Tax=Methanoculleus sp. TaxID=90427 RepID=UPI0025DD5D7E|nr:hypothetical protein [Methanoculleus sp.]MCK9320241.1 hypothetical protein [Methanoculleus sp.]